jgi:hypothetical protein
MRSDPGIVFSRVLIMTEDGKRVPYSATKAHAATSDAKSPLKRTPHRDSRLAGLADLAVLDIETSMVSNLSGSLHSLFDDVCDKTLPIYFGPLLGRLFLEGL